MAEYTASNGTKFTDADIERWAAQAEAGYAGWEFGQWTPGPPTSGRPVSVGAQARPVTIRLDAIRRARLRAEARERGITVSQLIRNLIDAL